jgi:hypothetical protein
LAGTVMAFGVVLAYTYIVHSADQTLADHAALQLSAGGNPAAALTSGSVHVYSLAALQHGCTTSECYYAPPCTVRTLACVVYVNRPIHAFGGIFPVLSKGVAPWQP